jgi:hypothetical protein
LGGVRHVDYPQVPTSLGLAERDPRIVATGSILHRSRKNIFDFLLKDGVAVDVRLIRRWINVEPNRHVRDCTLRNEFSEIRSRLRILRPNVVWVDGANRRCSLLTAHRFSSAPFYVRAILPEQWDIDQGLSEQ